MHRPNDRPPRLRTPALIAMLVSALAASAAHAAKGRAIQVDDDPRVGAADAPLVLIEFGHHL